jgi:hypothetical protein
VSAPPAQTWVHPLFEGIDFMMMMMWYSSSHTHIHNILVEVPSRGFHRRKYTDRIERVFEWKDFVPDDTRFNLLDFVLLTLTISTLVIVDLIRCDLNQLVSEEHNQVVLVRQMKNLVDRVATSEDEGRGRWFVNLITSSCDTIGLGWLHCFFVLSTCSHLSRTRQRWSCLTWTKSSTIWTFSRIRKVYYQTW